MFLSPTVDGKGLAIAICYAPSGCKKIVDFASGYES